MIWKTTNSNEGGEQVAAVRTSSNNLSFNSLFLFLSLLLFLGLGSVSAQTAPGVAPVLNPTGGFGIDGDLKSNIPVSGIGDWVQGASGSGGFVLNNNGTPVDGTLTALIQDAYDGNDNAFTQGSKAGNSPASWSWTTGNATGKGDINNAMYHIAKSANGDEWLVVGADRKSVTGDAYIDFGFYQNTIATTGSGFSTQGPHGGRTINDILVTVQFENGGAIAKVYFYLWEAVGNGYAFVEKNISTVQTYAAVNATAVDVPFGAFGTSQYQPQQFAEAAVNLTEILGTVDPCIGISIKTLLIKTKNANSDTAALNDFVEPIQTKITFGTATIDYSYAGSICEDDSDVAVDFSGVTGGTFSAPAGLSIDATTGKIDVSASTPGTYQVTYTYNTKGCEKYAYANVTIYENPGVPVVSSTTNASCGEDNGEIVFNVVSGNTYTITDSENNTYSHTNGIVSNLPAGTYTITASNGNCTAEKTGITISADADETDPTLSVSADIDENTSTTSCDASIAVPDATFSDNCSGAALSYVLTGATTGSGNGQVGTYTFNIGITTITYKVTDGAGNSVSKNVKVTVTDNVKPVITACAADITNQPADEGSCSATNVNLGTITATDNCDTTLTITNDAPNVFPAGSTTVTWTVTDDAGNFTTCTQVVTVLDNQDPKIISCAADKTVNADAGLCTASGVDLGSVEATDNCDTDLSIT
ncbi:MAG: HYR domain-containing protein, partial [Bacteroidota bacterium]|nr:HYR domain-containing protein [Bacteroidota bacterium]